MCLTSECPGHYGQEPVPMSDDAKRITERHTRGGLAATIPAPLAELPEHLAGAIDRFVDQRLQPGDCLRALLAYDMREYNRRADNATMAASPALIRYIFNTVPEHACGSYLAVDSWCNQRHIL